MEPPPPPLAFTWSKKKSDVMVILHPLALLTISDYITRHTLRQQQGPIVGALLGRPGGREITIEHTFECRLGGASWLPSLERNDFMGRLEQMVLVHKDRNLDLVGWYTTSPTSGLPPHAVSIHTEIMEHCGDSALVLAFHPQEALSESVGGKLPLSIYEGFREVENTRTDDDGEDQKMEEDRLEAKTNLVFSTVKYMVETDETEMISMNYITGSGGSAAATAKEERPVLAVESNGKGKRRLVESDTDEVQDSGQDVSTVLTRAEDDLIANLNTKANAIKMLHSRIQLLTTYLERLPPSYISGQSTDARGAGPSSTVPSLAILRQIQALVSRLNLVIPSDEKAYGDEMLQEQNDVNLLDLLDSIMQSVGQVRSVGKKFHVVESAKASSRRSGPADYMPAASMGGLGGGADFS